MTQKKYLVTLSDGERGQLTGLLASGRRSARTLTRAHILLKADQAHGGPGWDDARIADAFGCGRRTVQRVRQRFVAGRWAFRPHPPVQAVPPAHRHLGPDRDPRLPGA